jgi:hypothetical protein
VSRLRVPRRQPGGMCGGSGTICKVLHIDTILPCFIVRSKPSNRVAKDGASRAKDRIAPPSVVLKDLKFFLHYPQKIRSSGAFFLVRGSDSATRCLFMRSCSALRRRSETRSGGRVQSDATRFRPTIAEESHLHPRRWASSPCAIAPADASRRVSRKAAGICAADCSRNSDSPSAARRAA